jgi:hypothetical protein
MMLTMVTIAPVKLDKHHEIAVKVFDREPSIKVCGPSALDLHSAGTVFLRSRRNQVIAREVGIGLECLNALD